MTSPDSTPPGTLATLMREWGEAYLIGYQHDQWSATRRDGHAVLMRTTLTALETAIETDHRTDPVPRTFDPPGSTADENEPGAAPSEDESFLLTALREAFPDWEISYDPHARTWTARTRKTMICQPTAVLLCAALVGADRRARRIPGPGPGPGLSPSGS
jgi:hypothetical protein